MFKLGRISRKRMIFFTAIKHCKIKNPVGYIVPKQIYYGFYFLFLLLLSDTVYAEEYAEKANHLYRFAQYVQWSKGRTITVCILGSSPLGNKLAAKIKGKKIAGRTLKYITIGAKGVNNCNILFISKKVGASTVKSVLKKLHNGILSVGEQSNFIKMGGMINLLISKNKVRYYMNANMAKKKKLKLEYKMIQSAQK